MFSRSLLDAPRRLVDVQVLSPLAVLPAWQRKGMGAALVRRGLELMAESDAPVVFVEGPPRLLLAPGIRLVYSDTFWRHDAVGLRDPLSAARRG
jgi:putative acetyltransferase